MYIAYLTYMDTTPSVGVLAIVCFPFFFVMAEKCQDRFTGDFVLTPVNVLKIASSVHSFALNPIYNSIISRPILVFFRKQLIVFFVNKLNCFCGIHDVWMDQTTKHFAHQYLTLPCLLGSPG